MVAPVPGVTVIEPVPAVAVHVPPAGVLVNVTVAPRQTDVGVGLIAVGVVYTVTVRVAKHGPTV